MSGLRRWATSLAIVLLAIMLDRICKQPELPVRGEA